MQTPSALKNSFLGFLMCLSMKRVEKQGSSFDTHPFAMQLLYIFIFRGALKAWCVSWCTSRLTTNTAKKSIRSLRFKAVLYTKRRTKADTLICFLFHWLIINTSSHLEIRFWRRGKTISQFKTLAGKDVRAKSCIFKANAFSWKLFWCHQFLHRKLNRILHVIC